jgi:hypothetical protein
MPPRVFDPRQHSFRNIRAAAVAITISGPDQRHLGVLHRDGAEDDVFLLHLEFHNRLTNEPASPLYAWVDLQLPELRLAQVAMVCRKIVRENGRSIPFAFSVPNDCFDADSCAFLFGPTMHGLTCATFVVAVFKAIGISLVNVDSWPKNRADDIKWKEQVISKLKQVGASDEHICYVEEEKDLPRFRPEEVAGAAACDTWPADFDSAQIAGSGILELLVKNGLQLGP